MNDRSPPTPLRARLRLVAAQAILDAAEAVFAEQGPQAGMDAIASRAGVAVGTIYNHFGDRDGLVRALLRTQAEQLLSAMDAAIDAGEAEPFRAQLVGALRAVVDVTEPRAAFRRMSFQTDLARPVAERQELARAIGERLGRVLARGEAEGSLAPDPVGLRPVLLLGMLHAAVMVSVHDCARLPTGRIAEVVTDQFLDGAAVRAGGAS